LAHPRCFLYVLRKAWEALMADWFRYLKEERARKLASIDALASGGVVISLRTDGVLQDVSERMITEQKWHIAEIEEILAATGKPFDL